MRHRKVLFVDDEEKILKSIKRHLMDEPYETLTAASGKEALEVLQQNDVHVIVTDIRMPKMSGPQFLEIVKNKYPYIIRLALSGYAPADALSDTTKGDGIFGFISKPWTEEGLKTTIRQAIEYHDLHDKCETRAGSLK
jgi:two-component system response regulator HupR/HoxA